MIKLLIHGYLGKMGRVITSLAQADAEIEIVAGVDAAYPSLQMPFPTYACLDECTENADVIIDFSYAGAVPLLLDYSVKSKIPAVICTTGLTEQTMEKINEAAKSVAIFKSANMSLGVNLLVSILKKYSKSLYESGFDIEIIEKHHREKLDAPSGTAILLADSIKSSLSEENTLDYNYDRSKVMEKRKREEIGISAVRGGTIVGEHEVIFAGKDEVMSFSHQAQSKELFAVGALKAAKFLAFKGAGLYDMELLVSDIVG